MLELDHASAGLLYLWQLPWKHKGLIPSQSPMAMAHTELNGTPGWLRVVRSELRLEQLPWLMKRRAITPLQGWNTIEQAGLRCMQALLMHAQWCIALKFRWHRMYHGDLGGELTAPDG